MKTLIENLLDKHEEELNEVFDSWLPIHLKCSEAGQGNGTTGSADCKFLQLLCIERKPKKILEIGTWVGNTAYAMSFATKGVGAVIHTCDEVSWGNDNISEIDMFLKIDLMPGIIVGFIHFSFLIIFQPDFSNNQSNCQSSNS